MSVDDDALNFQDMLEIYANKIDAPTAEDAVGYWIQTKALGYENDTFMEIWTDKFARVCWGFFVGVDAKGKAFVNGTRGYTGHA